MQVTLYIERGENGKKNSIHWRLSEIFISNIKQNSISLVTMSVCKSIVARRLNKIPACNLFQICKGLSRIKDLISILIVMYQEYKIVFKFQFL